MNKTVRFFSIIIVATIACLVLGVFYRVPAAEKQSGLTGQFDVAADGTVIYVAYEKGRPNLIRGAEKPQKVARLEKNESILDLVITKDGRSVIYVLSDKELGKKSKSIVREVNLTTGKVRDLFTVDAIVTELAIDPQRPGRLFYLQADRFSDYSPGASLYPYDYDVHMFSKQDGKRQRITDLNQSSMASLQVSSEEEAIYVQMDDDDAIEHEDGLLETKARVFKIPVGKPEQKQVISISEDAGDLYDFVLIPERTELIYQTIAGTSKDGLLEYELFSYNWETQVIEQLTNLHAYAEFPTYGADGKVYFVVDRAFGETVQDNALYRMNPDGSKVEELSMIR